MGKKHLIETVTLKKVVLLEASCKRVKIDPDKTIEVRLSYDINFSEQSEKTKNEFSLNLNSKLVATDEEQNEFFSVDALFQGDFVADIQNEFSDEDYKDVSGLLGDQAYPYIRGYLTDILVKMDVPLHLPWAFTKRKNVKGKKSRPAKKQPGRKSPAKRSQKKQNA